MLPLGAATVTRQAFAAEFVGTLTFILAMDAVPSALLITCPRGPKVITEAPADPLFVAATEIEVLLLSGLF